MRILLSENYDPTTGMTTRYYHDPAAGKIIIQQLQDVEPTFDDNRRLLNADSAKARFNKPEGLGRRVARIPFALIEKWKREEGFDIFKATKAEIARKLNDPHYSKLRTAHGRI